MYFRCLWDCLSPTRFSEVHGSCIIICSICCQIDCFFILERRGGEQGKGPKENSQCFFFYLFNGLIYLLLSNGQVIWPVLDALQAVYAWALILSQYQVFLIALCKCPQLRGVQTAPVQERYILWSDIDYLKIDWHFQTCVLFFFGMTRVFHFNWKI